METIDEIKFHRCYFNRLIHNQIILSKIP